MTLWPVIQLEVKFVIVVCCTGVILLSLITVICFLLPDSWWRCWWQGGDLAELSQTIRPETALNHTKLKTMKSATSINNLRENSFDMVAMSNLGTQRSNRTYSQDSGRPISHADSCSTISSLGSTISRSPQISLAIQFVTTQENQEQEIVVAIEQCQDLPTRSYCETVDSQVHLRLERKRALSLVLLLGGSLTSSRGGGRVLAEDHTCPVVQRSLQPCFKHSVTLPLPPFTSIKDCQLIATVEDDDKLLGRNELGRCRVDLAQLLALPVTDQQAELAISGLHFVNRPLKSPKVIDKGDILIGLSFLPTSQRITVQIGRFNRLPLATNARRDKALTRIYLLSESGRILKKRKTAPKDWPSSSPASFEVDEHFHLDVEMDQWDHCVLLVVLEKFITDPNSGSVDYQPSGHVSLGKRVVSQPEQIHWNSAFQSPRKLILQWHAMR